MLKACALFTSSYQNQISYSPGTLHRIDQQEQGVLPVKGNIEERAVELAQYIVENRTTVRSVAARFGISKSTVHMVIY